MLAETLIVVPLLLNSPYPWGVGDLQPPTLLPTYMGASPSSLNVSALISAAVVVGAPSQPEVATFIQIPSNIDPLDMRDISYRKLVSEIAGYKVIAAATDDSEAWDASRTIERVLAFLDAIPADVPLPKSMLLSGQLALYWEFGDAYAEIDFDESECVDAYGKRQGMNDVSIDRLQITDRAGQVFFPTELERIIVGDGS